MTLFRTAATLFQHCDAVLRYKSSLEIVPCNITLRGVSKFLVRNARGKKLATRVTCGAETRRARKTRLLIRPCLSHLRHRSCPFHKRSLPFLRHFLPVIETVSMKKKENRNLRSNQASKPNPSYRNLSPLPLHYHLRCIQSPHERKKQTNKQKKQQQQLVSRILTLS